MVENELTQAQRNTKKIAVVGLERCDILYHLVDIGVKAGHEVCVIDNSRKKDFANLFDGLQKEKALHSNRLTVCKNTLFRDKNAGQFDYVFMYTGMDLCWHEDFTPDIILVMATYEQHDILRIKELLEPMNKQNVICIFRDKVSRKVSEVSACATMGFIPRLIKAMEFSYKAYGAYICLSHNKHAKLKAFGPELESLVKELGSNLYGLARGQIRDMVK